MFDKLHLSNMLRSEVEHIPDTGLPLDAFPDKIQDLILNLASFENFNVEYTASIILSAVAAAVGNSCQIRIKGEWITSPHLYMMLVGRPGLGKTPPMGFIYKPIREWDERLFQKYIDEYDAYEEADCEYRAKNKQEQSEMIPKEPHLVTTVISDFTPEAMVNTHQNNLRGITLVVDEILALFNSVNRYNNKNNLIEDLLTAYSGQPLKVIRKTESRPVLIRKPCINLIGSIQTNLLSEVFRKEFTGNGLLDRFLFVYPKDKTISSWKRGILFNNRPDLMNQWRGIMEKIIGIPCLVNGNTVESRVLAMSEEAEEYFYDWYNGIIDSVNAIENDDDVESRKMKLNGHAARLALLFQIMKWATGSEDMQTVSLESVKAAIRMVDYYEDTYKRVLEVIVTSNIGETREAWLSLLDDSFTTAEAVMAGKKVDMSRRTVYYALEQLCRVSKPLIAKVKHGQYRKLQVEI